MKRTLVLLLLLVLVPSGAFAASLTVGSVAGSCGGTLTVPVRIDVAAGLLAAEFKIAYDSTKLTAGTAAVGSAAPNFSISSNAVGGVLSVALASGTAAPAGTGPIANLTFTVSSSAAAGSTPLSISGILLNDQTSSGQSGTVTISCGAAAATWLLPSSARVSGVGGTFWTTDLTLRNTGTSAATATLKFLGHGSDGRGGPESNTISLAAGETRSFGDILNLVFALTSDYGPIQVKASSASFVVLGQTSTPGGGGTYGQSVPAFGSSDLIAATPRSIAAVREDSSFRTNLVLCNATESPIDVDVALVSSTGAVLKSTQVGLGPLAFQQLNVKSNLGVSDVRDAALVLSTPTAGGSFAAYASAIDSNTGDPRTLLPR